MQHTAFFIYALTMSETSGGGFEFNCEGCRGCLSSAAMMMCVAGSRGRRKHPNSKIELRNWAPISNGQNVHYLLV